MELFTNLNYWQWWIIALIFIILEMFAPGAFMLWLGIAAAVVGLIMAIFPDMGWEIQYSIFAVVSVISIIAWKPPAAGTTPFRFQRYQLRSGSPCTCWQQSS